MHIYMYNIHAYIYIYIYIYIAIDIESWPEWDLSPRPHTEFCSDALTN